MDSVYQFLIGILTSLISLVILLLRHRNTISDLYNNSIPAPWSLKFFLKNYSHQTMKNTQYLFTEQLVTSRRYRIKGRFDQAILHSTEKPTLDMIIENKFPVHVLPNKVHSEDMFQAGLYALALMDQRISITSTKLVIIYCLQKYALECTIKSKHQNCLKCGHSRVFVNRFAPSKVIKKLRKLDEVWNSYRKPKASPNKLKCRICPYDNSRCKYSKT